MNESAKKKKYYTFMVVPHDNDGKPLSFRVSSFTLRYVFLVLVVGLIALSSSIIYSTFLSHRLANYNLVVERNSENSKKLDNVLTNKDTIKQELQSVLDQNNELRKTLGLKVKKVKIDFDGKSKKKSKSYGLNIKLNEVNSMLALSFKATENTKISLEELKARVKDIQSRLASTPSTWPIRGRIVSRFGYRISPWRGMHTGVDIKASYGAPVHSAGPGVVCYSGWQQGYGKTVEIDHGYGFKTLYGHNSKIMVAVGQKVIKGQLLSYVGMTGYTTGPHLHYEVRKYDSPINPVAFLDLNIKTAGKYF